ncbi:AraC family transcriptional regulator [Cerasicoccus frondis]|uniref:AraC family transcriptional regulator n=1 Tax=Cerasicoccus frondis TaxID=490090 RepID=UPI0028528566|nr:AraC family transcriptional regulator [Cerasicoccus frondis]
MRIFSEITPNYVGDFVYGKRGEFGPRKQPHLQLVYFYNGRIRVHAGSAIREFQGGEAFFMIPGVTYRLLFDPDERVRHGWVDLLDVLETPDWAKDPANQLRAFAFTERMRALAAIANDAPRQSADSEGDLRHALGRAIAEEALLASGIHEAHNAHLPPAIIRAERILTQHYTGPLTLDKVAQRAGVSKAHLIRLYRQHLGVTPARRLWKIRVEASAKLLRNTGLQIQEVADRCGFPSPYHFSRLFKQRYGVPPTKYREQAWNGEEQETPKASNVR